MKLDHLSGAGHDFESLTSNPRTQIMLWIGGAIVAAIVGWKLLQLLFWMTLKAANLWQLTLILVVLGGFIGHGWGAAIGFVVAGVMALVVERLNAKQRDDRP